MVKVTDVPMITLNNGVQMPQIGLGVWEAKEGTEVKQAIAAALEAGYRLIDTAKIYGNERSVGEAIKESGIPREEIFVTTKLWNSDQGTEAVQRAYDESLELLGMDYVDLYLIHWPAPQQNKYVETWRMLEEMYADNRMRAIGVSNFNPHHLEDILAESGATVPAVNQIELHPHHQQLEVREFSKQLGIQVESYSPLKRGGDVLDEEVIAALATRHHKSPGQIVLRWHIQEGLAVIPKSVTPSRIADNIDIFGFSLSDEDMLQMRSLNRDDRLLPDPNTMNAD